jgi:hypothetical protein
MKNYIDRIQNIEIKQNIENAYNSLPEYFIKVPASSTGKYHPSFSLGEGGLLRHTFFALDISLALFEINNFTNIEKDICLSALILHDGLKHGIEYSEYTQNNHADIMEKYLKDFWINNDFIGKNEIIICIKTHMGQWSIEKKPETKLERFVHMCDYLASRKFYDNYYLNQEV